MTSKKLLLESSGILMVFFIFYKAGLTTTFFIFFLFYLIFRNLDSKKHKISAYSVFNKNFEELPGTFGPDMPGLKKRTKYQTMDSSSQRDQILEFFDKPQKKGKSKCFCGSQKLFRKCCLPKKDEILTQIFAS